MVPPEVRPQAGENCARPGGGVGVDELQGAALMEPRAVGRRHTASPCPGPADSQALLRGRKCFAPAAAAPRAARQPAAARPRGRQTSPFCKQSSWQAWPKPESWLALAPAQAVALAAAWPPFCAQRSLAHNGAAGPECVFLRKLFLLVLGRARGWLVGFRKGYWLKSWSSYQTS